MLNQRDDVGYIRWNGDCGGDDPVDARAFGIRGADASVGDQHAPNLTPVERIVKLRFPMAGPQTTSPRAQLIHIEVDRRLGHEWDEWNGRPLPQGGDFSAEPGLFFRVAAVTVVAATAGVALLLYLIGPRFGAFWAPMPRPLRIALASLGGLATPYAGLA